MVGYLLVAIITACPGLLKFSFVWQPGKLLLFVPTPEGPLMFLDPVQLNHWLRHPACDKCFGSFDFLVLLALLII